ncbi:MAG: hypothetical protein WD187_02210 [Candidatus Woykebacteria bacterium]
MKINRLANISILVLIFISISTRQANAYLDPGTGSYILQLLVAGGLGGAFAVKTFWSNIVSFLSKIFGRKNKTAARKKSNAKE